MNDGKTAASCDLHGQAVLVTRPALQSADLRELIQQAGGEVVLFPTVSIKPSNHADQAKDDLASRWDIVIFISRNAVKYAAPLYPGGAFPQTPPDGPLIGAVGAATAAELNRLGRAPDLVPNQHFDSEGLLELDELTQVRGRRILIVRGEGGRPMLGDTLTQRGALVTYAEVYRRDLPDQAATDEIDKWQQSLGYLTATSQEVLENLDRLIPEARHRWLRGLPLAVYSSRTAARAMELGYRTVAVASEASDPALVDALCRLKLSLPASAV